MYGPGPHRCPFQEYAVSAFMSPCTVGRCAGSSSRQLSTRLAKRTGTRRCDRGDPSLGLHVAGLVVFIVGGERLFAGRSLEEHDAYTPHVGSRAKVAATGLLGGHILGRSRSLPVPRQGPGDAQVDHLRQLALGDHVGGFQVQMQDVVAVEVLDGRAQVYPEVDDVREREEPGAGC